MFNLNDGRWGRGDDGASGTPPPSGQAPQEPPREPQRPGRSPQAGPPDLDELWRDLNQKLGKLFGGRGG